jgi:hypothetical protein
MDEINRFCNGDISRALIQHDCESWDRYPCKINEDGFHLAEICLAKGEPSRL